MQERDSPCHSSFEMRLERKHRANIMNDYRRVTMIYSTAPMGSKIADDLLRQFCSGVILPYVSYST